MEKEIIHHTSELFDVKIVAKSKKSGLTKDMYIVKARPLVEDEKVSVLIETEVSEEDYNQIKLSDCVKMRLYEQSDGTWKETPEPLEHDPNRGLTIIGDGEDD